MPYEKGLMRGLKEDTLTPGRKICIVLLGRAKVKAMTAESYLAILTKR